MKILFVCTGNTCRSPMAQALAKQHFPAGTTVLSAGLQAWPGDKVSSNAAKAMQEKGLNIQQHTAVSLHKEILESADYVFTMTKSQEECLSRNYPEYKDKIKTIAGFLGLAKDISDPWGQSLEAYRSCARELEQIIEEIAKRIFS